MRCPSAATAWSTGSRAYIPIPWNDLEFSQVLCPALGWFPGVSQNNLHTYVDREDPAEME